MHARDTRFSNISIAIYVNIHYLNIHYLNINYLNIHYLNIHYLNIHYLNIHSLNRLLTIQVNRESLLLIVIVNLGLPKRKSKVTLSGAPAYSRATLLHFNP